MYSKLLAIHCQNSGHFYPTGNIFKENSPFLLKLFKKVNAHMFTLNVIFLQVATSITTNHPDTGAVTVEDN
jgi:hypothetical protein